MDLLFAWIASVASGIEPLVVKASSKSLVKNPWLFNLLWTAFGIPPVMVLGIIQGGGMPHDWLSLLLLSFSSALFSIFYIISIYKVDITTIAPLFSLRTVFAVFLGIIFLHEKVNSLGIILIGIIVLLSIFASYDEKLRIKAFFQKYILLAIFAMLVLALKGYFTNISVAHNGYATTILWQDFLTELMFLPTVIFIDFKKEKFSLKQLYPFLFLGATGFLYSVTSTLAYSHSLALTSVIISLPLSMIFTYFLSWKYSRFLEKHTTQVYIVRFTAAFIMIGCAIWLSYL